MKGAINKYIETEYHEGALYLAPLEMERNFTVPTRIPKPTPQAVAVYNTAQRTLTENIFMSFKECG